MMKTMIMAAFLASAGPAIARETVGEQRLLEIANSIRDFESKDQFDAPPKPTSIIGQRFSVLIKPIGTSPAKPSCSAYPSWQYRAADNEFSVSVSASSMSSYQIGHNSSVPKEKWHNISHLGFFCKLNILPKYKAQNGFGAEFLIDAREEYLTGIAYSGKFDPKWKTYWIKKMPPEAARALSKSVRVRVSGTLGKWSSGESVYCGTMRVGPNARFKRDIRRENCLFKGDVELFEVVNIDTGEVLLSSKRKNSKRKK